MLKVQLTVDAGDFSGLVLLDLFAAFDTADLEILPQPLETSYSLSGTVLRWFKTYLVGRLQHVRHGCSASLPRLCDVVHRKADRRHP